MFRNREDAARRLAEQLSGVAYKEPLVIAISNGGVVTAATIAEILGAELDILHTRRLRAPGDPTLAIGTIAETGDVHLNHHARRFLASPDWFHYLEGERESHLTEMQEAMGRMHQVLPPAHVAGRSVLAVDDGVATGSTMIVALKAVRFEMPRELIAVAPVVAADITEEVSERCDKLICLESPEELREVRDWYEQYEEVTEEHARAILKKFSHLRSHIDLSRWLPSKERAPAAGGDTLGTEVESTR